MNLSSYAKSLLEKNKFLLFGEEDHFISYAVDKLKTKLQQEFASFNYIEIDHKSTTYNDALTKIESVPMMDNCKVVHIKGFQFAQSSNNIWSKEEYAKFLNLVQDLSLDINLVVSNSSIEVKSENSKRDNYPKYLKELGKYMEVWPLRTLSYKEIEIYIENYINEKTLGKLKLEKNLIKYYVDLTGYLFKDSDKNIREVNADLDKIIGYIGQNSDFTTKDMDKMFLRDYDADIFKLIDFIIKNNKVQAFQMYSNLLKKGEPSNKIMVTIGNSLSLMIKSSYYHELGYTQAMIADQLSKNPYAIKKGLENLKIIGRKKAILCMESILEIDYKLKNGLIVENVYGEIALSRIFRVLEEQ